MDITSTADFAADPETVFQMLVNREYLKLLVAESRPLREEVTVDGNQTTTIRTLAAPSEARRFTGPELTIVEELTWGTADGDGRRDGRITMTVPHQPVNMTGTVTLSPGGRGTVVRLDGELKVNIPLLGRKFESLAAPAVMSGFADHQQVGDRWLAAH